MTQPCDEEKLIWQEEDRTLNIILKDLREDGEEGFLKAADCRRVSFAGDPHRQAQRLKQVVIKMRLAGILKRETMKDLIHAFKTHELHIDPIPNSLPY